MLTIKPQALSVSSRPVPKPAGKVVLVVTCMAGFDMDGGRPKLCSDQVLWKTLSKLLPPKTTPDLGMEKPWSEWLAFGHVYPKDKQALSAQALVMVKRGEELLSRKHLHVSGARYWNKTLNLAWPAEPVPIGGPIALDWIHAFGGKGHQVNPGGKGFYGENWLHQMLPQIEYADDLIASPADRPRPAGLGPLPLDAPSRFKPHGTYDSKWMKQDYPALASDTPPEVLMVGPTDQHIPGVFKAGDVFRCEGMSRDGRVKSWTLPEWQARCFIRRKLSGPGLIPVDMQLDTVWLMPNSGLLGQMWRGVIEITEADAHDVNLLLAGLEDASSPKGLNHYAEVVLARSSGQRDAVMSSLDESSLLPAGQLGSLLPSIPPAAKKHIAAVVSEAKAKAQDRIDQAKVIAPGVDLKIPGSVVSQQESKEETKDATKEDPANQAAAISEEMVQILSEPKPDGARLAVLVKQAQALGAQARKLASAKITAAMQAKGVDLKSKADKKVQEEIAGPPVRKMQAMLTRLEQNVQAGRMSQKQLDQMRPKFSQLINASIARYRKAAHWMPEAAAVHDPKALGDQITAWVGQGSLGSRAAGCDWVGADLSARKLDGANFSGAFMDGASFVGASLVGADLRNATFAGADFSGANLSGANLSGANLGKCRLVDVNLQGAILNRAVLDQAQLDGASLINAKLEGATLIGINFGRVDLSGANFKLAKLLGLKLDRDMDVQKLLGGKLPSLKSLLEPIDISQVKARGASMEKATLLAFVGTRANFSKVNFLNASFAHCHFSDTDFTQANFVSTSLVLETKLPKSNFENATIVSSFFNGVDLHASNMRGANLSKSNFGLSNMSGVDASFTKAGGARFERTNLAQATFSDAQLAGALFMGANIKAACFDFANLTHVDFSKVDYDSQTSFVQVNKTQAKMPQLKGAS